VKGGGGGKLLLALLLLGVGGAAAVWFLEPEWVPEPLRARRAVPLAPPPAPVAQVPTTIEVKPERLPAPPPAPVPAPPKVETPAPVEKAPAPVEKAPETVKEAPQVAKEAPTPRGAKGLVAEAKKLRERGKTEKALDLFGRAVELDPENAEALAGRGWCYLDLSQYAPAKASFQGALEQDPYHAEALIGLAETFRYEGRRADAVKWYERYLAAHPGGDDAVAARNAITQLKE
jgi:tetratricopeptide (TPR) repeat protein